METISSRESSNLIPVVGLVAGVVALLLAVIAFVKANNAKTQVEDLAAQMSQLQDLQNQVANLSGGVESNKHDINKLIGDTQTVLSQISTAIGDVRSDITKLQDAQKAKAAPAPGGKAGAKEAPVAGPGEYVVKGGDTGVKIARANGVSLSDLMAVNPSVNWNKLHAGDKIKLPAKK